MELWKKVTHSSMHDFPPSLSDHFSGCCSQPREEEEEGEKGISVTPTLRQFHCENDDGCGGGEQGQLVNVVQVMTLIAGTIKI